MILYFLPDIHFAYISTLSITLAFIVSPASLKPITSNTLIKPEEWLIILTGGLLGTLIVLTGGIGISLAIPIFIIGSSISLVFSIGGIIVHIIIYDLLGELVVALIKGVATLISLSIAAAIKTVFLIAYHLLAISQPNTLAKRGGYVKHISTFKLKTIDLSS